MSIRHSFLQFRKQYRLLIIVIAYCWIDPNNLFAQPRTTTFGIFRSFPTPQRFDQFRILNVQRTSLNAMVFWHRRDSTFWYGWMDSTGMAITYTPVHLSFPVDNIIVNDFFGNKEDQLAVVHRQEKTIVFLNGARDTSRTLIGKQSLQFEPIRILVADINNDGKNDLATFRKNLTGIFPYFNSGKCTFKEGKLIAPDNAPGEIAFAYINDDDLLDLFLYDWVKSELHILYGIGKGEFLDQTVYPLEGDIKQIATSRSSDGRYFEIGMMQDTLSQMLWWEDDGFGDFHQRYNFPLRGLTVSANFADINSDGWREILMVKKPPLIEIYLNSEQSISMEPISLYAGTDPRQTIVHDINKDGNKDLLALDKEGKRLLVYFNSLQKSELTDSLDYVTGTRPSGVWIGDLNSDKSPELGVLNRGTASFSLLWGRKEKGLEGAEEYAISQNPRDIQLHSVIDSSIKFLISSPRSKSVSVFSIDLRDRTTSNIIIPLDGEAEILYSSTVSTGQLDFFCYTISSSRKQKYISFLQQVKSETFIEKTFRLKEPEELTGATVNDVNKDGIADLAFVAGDLSSSRMEFGVSIGDSALGFNERTFSYEFPFAVVQKALIWGSDFDNDGLFDFLVYLDGIDSCLWLFRGLNDSSFANPIVMSEKVNISNRTQLRIVDFDNDSVLDIVINDIERGIGWMKGHREGNFERWKELIFYPFIGGFDIGDLNTDGIPDLAISLNDGGTVRIYNGKMFHKEKLYNR